MKGLKTALIIVLVLALIVGAMLLCEMADTPVRASSLITTYVS